MANDLQQARVEAAHVAYYAGCGPDGGYYTAMRAALAAADAIQSKAKQNYLKTLLCRAWSRSRKC